MTTPLVLAGQSLSPADVEAVARLGRVVELDPAARDRLAATRRSLEACLHDHDPHYGINTGFGSFARTRVDRDDLRDLQRNLIRSHAAGVGDPLPVPTVRAMLVTLAASLARNRSGVRPELVDRVLMLLNRNLTPVVPETGSVGASGDLAPLAHASLALIGEGEVIDRESVTRPTADALGTDAAFTLEPKEGIALINGTHLMAGTFALLWRDIERLFPAALVAYAMSIDACRGTDSHLDPRVYVARNQPGPARVAAAVKELLTGSEVIPSHREDDPRVQDPYSLRCAPIVLGASLDLLAYAGGRLVDELGAVTDNPLIEPSRDTSPDRTPVDIISAGNFHGMPVAIPLDTVAIALAHLAGISERRGYYLLSARDPETGLRPFLSPKPGLHSGLMIVQYTAAACCNELIGLANPASVANIPTCAGTEDYNSYGPRSAAKAQRAVQLARSVIAAELLCAAQGIDEHRPLKSGEGVERAHAVIRERVPPLKADRSPAPDLRAIEDLIGSGAIADACGIPFALHAARP